MVINVENKPEMKSYSRYLFMIYCLILLFAWPVGLFWMAFTNIQYINLYILVMVPLALIATSMWLSLFIIPFKYSVFGPYKRRPFPNEIPLFKKSTSGRISLLNAFGPLIKFIIFPSGVGISILGTAKVFLPTQCIININPYSLASYKLKHNSPELRNPIIFHNKELYESLQNFIGFKKNSTG